MSEKTKFTPGPWTVEPVRDNNGKPYATSYEAWVFVEPSVCGLWAQAGSNLADAHLIAAAPELYEACENALECLIGCCVPAGGCDDRKTMVDTQAMLRAALKKARNE